MNRRQFDGIGCHTFSYCCHVHETLEPKSSDLRMREFSLPPHCKWDLSTSGMLGSVVVLNDFSGQHIVRSSRIEQKQNSHCAGIFQALGFQGVEALRFLYSQYKRVAKLSGLGTGHFYPQEIFLIPVCVGDWIKLRAIVRPEELCPWKIT